MSDQIIRVTARFRADGIDVDRLALALLELAEQLPASRPKPVKTRRKKPTATGGLALNSNEKEGAA